MTTNRFGDHPRVVDLTEATAELRVRRRALRERRRRDLTRKLRHLRVPRSTLWVAAFYAALAAITALWWHWDAVGLPRLLMGTVLLLFVLLAIGREVVWIHPVWIILLPALIVVAAFFYYPLAPAAVVLAAVFIVNEMWFV